MFGCRNLWSKLDAGTNNSSGFDAGYGRDCQTFKVGSGIGLTDMCREGASILRLWVFWESVAKVIVASWICPKFRVVLRWSKINGRSCSPSWVHQSYQISRTRMQDHVPLFHRPTMRAPRSSLPNSGATPGTGLCFRNASNSGTS